MQYLYAIYDSKSETYSAPTTNPSREQARRSFADAVNVVGCQPSVLSNHPQDFTLFELGSFDIETGEIKTYAKKAVANGIDVKIPEETQQ